MVRQVGRSLRQEDRELVGPIDEGYEHRGGYERLHRLHADVQRMVATLLGIIVGNERFVRNNSAASETILDPRARRCADHDAASDTQRGNNISGAVTSRYWPARLASARRRKSKAALRRIGEP